MTEQEEMGGEERSGKGEEEGEEEDKEQSNMDEGKEGTKERQEEIERVQPRRWRGGAFGGGSGKQATPDSGTHPRNCY